MYVYMYMYIYIYIYVYVYIYRERERERERRGDLEVRHGALDTVRHLKHDTALVSATPCFSSALAQRLLELYLSFSSAVWQ